MNGKIEIYKKFRAVLLKELGEEMPNDTVLYRNLRDRKESSPPHENDMDDASDWKCCFAYFLLMCDKGTSGETSEAAILPKSRVSSDFGS